MVMKNYEYSDTEITQYQEYAFEKDLLYIRPVLIISAILYGAFGALDYIFYPEYIKLFLSIRFLVVIPVILLGFLYTFHPTYKKYYQFVLVALMTVAGIGIVIMVYSITGDNYYYSGVSLIISIAFLLLRVKKIFAFVGSLTIILVFLLIGYIYSDVLKAEILANALFYCAFLFVGMVGSTFIERFRKNQYYHENLIENEKVVLEKKVFQHYESIKNYHYSMIYALATMAEARDKLTGNHIKRVGRLSYLLSKNLPEDIYEKEHIDKEAFLKTIEYASVLHDIGKIAISDLILNKPGKLTEEEFEIIKTHTTIGHKMLESMKDEYQDNPFINLGSQISKSHHERWDGLGYPDGLSRRDIPLSARIVAIIDVYDALISQRSYKEAYTKSRSIAIIEKGVGSQFDPVIAKTFISLVKDSNDESLFGQ